MLNSQQEHEGLSKPKRTILLPTPSNLPAPLPCQASTPKKTESLLRLVRSPRQPFIGPVIPAGVRDKFPGNNKQEAEKTSPKIVLNRENFFDKRARGATKKMHSPEHNPSLGTKIRKVNGTGDYISGRNVPLTDNTSNTDGWHIGADIGASAGFKGRGMRGRVNEIMMRGSRQTLTKTTGASSTSASKSISVMRRLTTYERNHDAQSILDCSSSSWQSYDGDQDSRDCSQNVSTNFPISETDSSKDSVVEESESNITLSRCTLGDSRRIQHKEDSRVISVEHVPMPRNNSFCFDGDNYKVHDTGSCAVVENINKVTSHASVHRNIVFSQEDGEGTYLVAYSQSDSEDSASSFDTPPIKMLPRKVNTQQTTINLQSKTKPPFQQAHSRNILQTKPLHFVDTDDQQGLFSTFSSGNGGPRNIAGDTLGKSSNKKTFKVPSRPASAANKSDDSDSEKAWYDRSDDDIDASLPLDGSVDLKYLSQSPPPPPSTPNYNFTVNYGAPRNNLCFWAMDFYKRTQSVSPQTPTQEVPTVQERSPLCDTTLNLSQGSEVKERRWLNNFNYRFSHCRFNYIDSHCHLDFLYRREGFRGTFAKYIETHSELFPKCFEGCVAVFCEPSSFRASGGLWKDLLCESNIWGAMGCHPKNATDYNPYCEDQLRMCIQHEKMMAVGEIGLDYSGTFETSKDRQKEVFVRQIKIAQAFDKPLVIHCRQAEDDCFELMKQYIDKDHKIHRHCFTKDWQEAQRWLDTFPNLYLGLTPVVTYRNAYETHDVARNVPLDRLLLETDAPYFVPSWIPRDEMKLSHPGLAIYVADEVAKLQHESLYTVLMKCRRNTQDMYGV